MKKIGTIINLSCLLIIVLFFELVKHKNWDPNIIVYETIPLLILIVSFIKYFWNTGLWSFTHRSLDKLDEKETRSITKALRISYAIFTVFILLTLMVYVLFNFTINMVLIVAFIYLAHILPAYILSWTNNNSYENVS